MKIVIDIDSEVYNFIRNRGHVPYGVSIANEIANGTPLEERQQGEWEDYSVNFYKCPECGYLLNKDCPNCQNKVILPKGGEGK